MNILLTGGTGYIGSHVAIALSKSGHRTVLFDNLSNSAPSMVDRLMAIIGQSLAFVRGDTRDTALLQSILREHRIEAVVHCAGLKVMGESISMPIDYYANNVQGTISLLQAMQAEAVNLLLFSSSAAVYGEPQYLPIDEQHPTGPRNPYGRTKLHIEEMLHDVALSDSSLRIGCLRYFNPVGAHESGLIGGHYLAAPVDLMARIADVAAGRTAELDVFGSDYSTSDGTGIRDYIHVMDLAEGHAAALEYLAAHPGWHAFNLGTGRGYSVLEMIRAFEAASGRPVPFKLAERRPEDVASCYANPEKAKRLLAWEARYVLDDMCGSTWKYQISAGAKEI